MHSDGQTPLACLIHRLLFPNSLAGMLEGFLEGSFHIVGTCMLKITHSCIIMLSLEIYSSLAVAHALNCSIWIFYLSSIDKRETKQSTSLGK